MDAALPKPVPYKRGAGPHGEKHMHALEAVACFVRPAMSGKSLPGGSRSSTMMEVSSFRPPCALSMALISLCGASCNTHACCDEGSLHVKL